MKRVLHTSVPGPASSVWSHRDARLAIPARAVSYFGDSLTLVVLSLQVAESGQPAMMTLLFAAFSLPLFLLQSVAGRLVDEHDSRLLLVVAGSVQVVASLGLVWSPDVWAIVGFVTLLQVGQAVTGPTWAAVVPRIVGDRLVGKAVGVQQSLSSLAGLGGAAAGGVLYAAIGYHGTLLLDTATFALLVLVGAIVRTRRGRQYDAGRSTAYPATRVASPVYDDTPPTSGAAHIFADDLLRLLVPALWLFVLAVEATNVVEVFLVTDDLGASSSAYGVVTAAMMLGQIAGPLLAARITAESARVAWTSVCAAALGVLLVLIGASPSVWLVFVLFAVCGVAGGALNALIGTLVVTRTPEELRGRVLSSLGGTARGFSVGAMVIGGLGGQVLGARVTFMLCGSLGVLAAGLVLKSRRGLTRAPVVPVGEPPTAEPAPGVVHA